MTTDEFIEKAIEMVNEETDFKYNPEFVWFSYTLGNMKGLIITVSPDNFYYEVTYNKSKNEIYFDKYTKIKHKIMPLQ